MIPAVGAWALASGTVRFRVWAPRAETLAVDLLDDGRVVALTADDAEGYWAGEVAGVEPGARYRYVLDGERSLPDPASMSQPDGVHGPSALVDPGSAWTDAGWRPPRWPDEWVLWEAHVGTATPAGTFGGLVDRLDDLVALGVTALELMPVAEFPGRRNWGYDGVFAYAAHHAYGGLDGLRRLVDAAHARGLAVVLDVVYNHLGPEGNVLAEYGPYFTDRYSTPWGAAVNVDGAGSDAVRDFLVGNARFWAEHAHVDGFRLDAVHAIVDPTAYPFVAELADSLHALGDELGRPIVVIGEDAEDDPRLSAPAAAGGAGLDGQWNDGFHHALHTALTGEHTGYYADHRGGADLAVAYQHGFVHRGRHSPGRGRRHGHPRRDPDPARLVVFAQNHDQVGNRMRGERLAALAGFERAKLAAALVLLAPGVPLLFMGEEDGETRPFPYFVDHGDRTLVEAVRKGRRAEFAAFHAEGEPPDPAAPATFASAVLDPASPRSGEQEAMRALHTDLLALRRAVRPRSASAEHDAVTGAFAAHVDDAALVVAALGDDPVEHDVEPGWSLVLATDAAAYAGPGTTGLDQVEDCVRVAPWCAAALVRDR